MRCVVKRCMGKETKPTDGIPWVKSAVSDPASAIPGLGVLMVLTLIAGAAYAEPRDALCRVNNHLATFNNVGSGTLVDKSDDGREGLVLTCAHLFGEGVGEVVVSFPGGKTHGAKLVAIDREADLAALAISNPANTQAAVDFEIQQTEPVNACGFGPHGEYACATGPIVGEAASAGQMSLLIGDVVRSGDSGGGVFDAEGNLVAVVWGEAGGVTYASAGEPLKRFLDRVLGRRTGYVYACPGGVCRRPRDGEVVRNTPTAPLAEASAPGYEELAKRIAALELNKQNRGDYITRGEVAAYLSGNAKAPAAADPGRAAVSLLELIGITTPAGWGVVALTTVGGWLAGRLLRRGVGGRRGEAFQWGAEPGGGFRDGSGTDVS
jgi:hypothetical protein